MTRSTLRQALLGRLPARHEDRGSIPFLLLVMVMATALGGALLSLVVGQTRTTRFDQTRIHSLYAAQAGVDVVLGKIRAALASDNRTGDDGLLPCADQNHPFTGLADNNGVATYSVWLTYYTANPANAGATAMRCTTLGPYDPTAQTRTPRFAVITSTGVDGPRSTGTSSGRVIQGTYKFLTDDINITGGVIRIYPGDAAQFCMDAGSNPAVGTAVLLQPCSTANPPIDQQVWAYRSDLSIELVASAKTTPTGLCLDTAPTAHAAGDAIVLKACSVADASVCPAGLTPTTYAAANPGKTCSVSSYNQQWSVDDNAHLRGANTGRTDTDSYCINVASQAANVALTLQSCAGSTTDTAQTWVPSPTAGAGMASAGNNQLVNYKQFAMCLDITGQQVGAAFEILYTCKQNPDPTKVLWNQKIIPSPPLNVVPTKTLLTVVTGGTTYCLKSPRTAGGYPTLSTPCPGSVTAPGSTGFVWTVSGQYADAAKTTELPYADKYTIKDDSATPLCLGPGANSDLYIGQYYKVVVTTCDGSTGQKWNAAASLDAATLSNLHEITTSGS